MQQQMFDFAQSHLVDSWDRLDRFVVGSNQVALQLLTGWLDDARGQHAYLFGGKHSGCTRLLHASCRRVLEDGRIAAVIDSPRALLDGEQIALLDRNHLLVLDNLDQLDSMNRSANSPTNQCEAIEEALYELFDRAQDQHCALLFAAHAPISELRILLPDLRTRLSSCLQIGLRPLDDYGLEQLAEQLLLECGVSQVPPGLGRMVLTYCRRDSANVVSFIRKMQSASLYEKKPVNVPFVRKYLQQLDVL